MEFRLKTADEIARMRHAGEIVAQTLRTMRDAIVPGKTTTQQLDDIALDFLAAHHATPVLKGYKPPFTPETYRHASCISINDEIIHGVPSAKRVLKNGALVTLDLAASVDGWCADATFSLIVGGKGGKKAEKLLQITREALYLGIQQARSGHTTGDIGYVIQRHAEKNGYRVAEGLVGHGIGRVPHEDGLDVPNEGDPGDGLLLEPGMTFCIEPMIATGTGEAVHRGKDPWTIFTADGGLACHWEHTVAVTDGDPLILTRPPAGIK